MNPAHARLPAVFLVGIAMTLAGCRTPPPPPPPPAPTITTTVVLLPSEEPGGGAVQVGEGQDAATLDTPYAAATIDDLGRLEEAVADQQTVERDFAAALAAQPPDAVHFTLYFEQGGTRVVADSEETLKRLFAEVARRQVAEVQVTGHTDRLGKEADNDRLSAQRAEAVREMLVDQGLASDFIRAVGRGEREPLVPTDDEVPERRNRRVEVIVR
jgi:outer membrane protein OmpA-like peptidoglycan-associated protein